MCFTPAGHQRVIAVFTDKKLAKKVTVSIAAKAADQAIISISAIYKLIVACAGNQRVITVVAEKLLPITRPGLQAIGIISAIKVKRISAACGKRIIAIVAIKKGLTNSTAMQAISAITTTARTYQRIPSVVTRHKLTGICALQAIIAIATIS